MFDYFKPKPGKTYAYSQNHTFIPITGLAVCAYALYDEVDEALSSGNEAQPEAAIRVLICTRCAGTTEKQKAGEQG